MSRRVYTRRNQCIRVETRHAHTPKRVGTRHVHTATRLPHGTPSTRNGQPNSSSRADPSKGNGARLSRRIFEYAHPQSQWHCRDTAGRHGQQTRTLLKHSTHAMRRSDQCAMAPWLDCRGEIRNMNTPVSLTHDTARRRGHCPNTAHMQCDDLTIAQWLLCELIPRAKLSRRD